MPILLRFALVLLLSLGSTLSFAQDRGLPVTGSISAATPAQSLDALDTQLDAVKSALKQANPPLADLRATAMNVQDQARQLAANLAPQMAALQAQLTVLGPAPANGAPAEAAEVATQRRQLDRVKANLDAQIKQAQLLGQSAQQLSAQITGMRNDQFQARLASRTATPFGRAFWSDPAHMFPGDMARVGRYGARLAAIWQVAWQPPNRRPLLLCLIGAALLLGGGRWALERMLFLLATRRVPDGHLRRSAMAAAVALTAVVTTGVAARLLYLGFNWNDIFDADTAALAHSTVRLTCFAAYVVGLGRALLSVRHPSWRLPALPDAMAQQLRPFPWWLAATALLFGVFESSSRSIGTSLPATVAARGAFALVISALIGMALARLHRLRLASTHAGATPLQRPLWISVLTIAATFAVIISVLAVATGYIALGFFVAGQMLWVGVVLATAYLLIHLLTDLVNTLLLPEGRGGRRMQATFDLQSQTLQQMAIVLSGFLRVALVILALATVLTPFGAGPTDLLESARQTFGGIKLGDLPIDPGSIFAAVLVFLVGLYLLRMLKRWLHDKLLPTSAMDQGMQDSLLTLLGYLGGVLVFVLALAALHVDLKSIAWIVSALSVGIGFGLQAIVQNFISGLILLVERPVKVGDWVGLNGVEGDIRRINVRATEIQLWDRSTVIVPNSQLITENVRNVTLANALGRVQFALPLPLDTDVNVVRSMIMTVLREHPGTLDTPASLVRLTDVDATSVTFTCTCYVNSPRDVGAVKSDLLFDILERLRAAGYRLARTQNMLVRTLSPTTGDDEPAG